jgi:tRNA threonylcarbamoyladenosine biosynthesis protein TsaE
MALEVVSHSAEETIALGRKLAQRLAAPVVVQLYGDLGSGKTTLTKGIISGLGAAREEEVMSPTFNLVHVFQKPASPEFCGTKKAPKVYHVDLYRVERMHDLETLGLEDAFAEPAIVIIEWSERMALRNDWPQVMVRLEHMGDEARRIVVEDTESRLPAQA